MNNIILIFLILLILISLYIKITKKENIVKILGHSIAIVVSGSMQPEIEKGEFILIQELKNYDVNDIVTYKESKNFYITHRIVKKYDNAFVTKGDNNNLEDGKIQEHQIIGKVVFHSKIIGFFIVYLLKPLYIIIILVMIYTSFRNKIGIKNEKKNSNI